MPAYRWSQKWRERDWWGVAIDLAILIVGVFLGIQAANWNQARQDRADGRQYLQRIRDDLRSDVQNLDARYVYWGASAASGKRALAFAEDGTGLNDWNLLNDFYAAGQRWRFTTNDSTYSELLSAGRLDLIDNAALRRSLADFYVAKRDQSAFLADSETGYRLGVRAVVPSQLQRYIIENCQPTGIILPIGKCPAPPDTSAIARVNRDIATNKALVGELRGWMTTVHYMREVARDRRATAVALIEEVDAAMR